MRIATTVLALCLFLSVQSPALAENTLNVGLYQDLLSFDPHASIIPDLSTTLSNLYESLVDVDSLTRQVVPMLSTTWEVSPDGLTYTFHLRKGVRFTDDTPFNAQSVAASVKRIQHFKRSAFTYVKPVASVKVLDDSTVAFHLKHPHSAFLRGLRWVMIVSPTAVAKHVKGGDQGRGWLNEHSAGTGPYQTDRWERGRLIVWKKNPTYWGGWDAKKFDRLNLRLIYETGSQRLMVEKGDLDIAQNVSLDDLPALRRNAKLRIVENQGVGGYHLFFNAAATPTNDVRVRKALSYAWNHAAYTALRGGVSPRMNGPTPEPLIGKKYDIDALYGYDLEKAKKLLQEAGYGGGLTLRFLSQKGDEQKLMQFQVLQSELKKLNVKLALIEESFPAMNKRLATWGRSPSAKTAVHLIAVWRPASLYHPWEFLYRGYHSASHMHKGGTNYGFYANPKVDALIDQAMTTVDKQKEMQLWQQANDLILHDAPAIFIENTVDRIVVRKELQGYRYRGNKIAYRYYGMSR